MVGRMFEDRDRCWHETSVKFVAGEVILWELVRPVGRNDGQVVSLGRVLISIGVGIVMEGAKYIRPQAEIEKRWTIGE